MAKEYARAKSFSIMAYRRLRAAQDTPCGKEISSVSSIEKFLAKYGTSIERLKHESFPETAANILFWGLENQDLFFYFFKLDPMDQWNKWGSEAFALYQVSHQICFPANWKQAL